MKVTIEKIFETKSFGANGFKKREWIGVETNNPLYPNPIKFECVKGKCDLLDHFTEGQTVNVEYNINGNRWTNAKGEEVIFNSIQAWKIEADNGTHDITPEHDQNESDINDLPFG